MIKCLRILFLSLMVFTPLWLYSQQECRVRLCFAGDLMQHGKQIRSARQQDGSYLYDTCFVFVKEHLKEADLTGMNIETTFSGPPYSGYPSFSSPNELAVAIQKSGVNLFLTANNHILDKGARGAIRTVALYDSLGILHCGTINPWIIVKRNGIRIAVLNYTYSSNHHIPADEFPVNRTDTLIIRRHIREVREKGVDCIICCMHWGTEYQLQPSGMQRSLADWLYNAGITAVIGSHPHVPQSIEVRKGQNGKIEFMTAYSLGNFISNQPEPFSRMGLLLSFDIVLTETGPCIESPWYEWIWTWQAVDQGKLLYHVLPVSDPRLYRKLLKDPSDTINIFKTIKTLRNFMRETSPGINERRRYPPYERENLYFGNHPSCHPVWARQPLLAPVKKSLSPIEDRRKGRTDQSTGTPGNH
ncbi:MAG: Capsule biosynthesis protein CapA [Bacteroidetes bacterium ADurb.Bin037]|nr:MAG: Capsule biosynthesis protein CapA [Bacteroidetes bacterium ADurb.Bin037]HPW78253.1 CapA family protein [Bacteroidales bacterium]HQB55855.1 CapA family protein [Bacteroidales bacterium]